LQVSELFPTHALVAAAFLPQPTAESAKASAAAFTNVELFICSSFL
jgi:hypothetical protein